MIYHVLPGDAQVEDFRKTGIEGEVIIFREAFVSGPIDSTDLDEFWEQRARFILSEYGDDEIAFQETVADEILKISDVGSDDEINLWFEFELFCSVNLWYCLSKLKGTGAKVFRVAPVNLEPDDLWKGFGGHGPNELQTAFDERVEMTPDDVATGDQLWDAFGRRDWLKLHKLGEYRSAAMPFLKEVTEAAAEIDVLPKQIVREIKSEGRATLEEVFPEFRERAGVFGFGDLQVERLMNE